MNMHELIKNYRKDYVFENYTRIVEKFKDYEKITKVKMLDEIYKVYDNPDNIIDICTTRELQYLEKVLNGKIQKNQYDYKIKDKYEWEVRALRSKFLLDYDKNIPEEMLSKIKEALKRVDWNEKKKIDELNELLVVYCKIQGTALVNTICEFSSALTGIDAKKIYEHMINNKLFNYYVFIAVKDIEGLGSNIPVAIYQDYYYIQDEIEEERKKQGLAGTIEITEEKVKTLFYNDFDIKNSKIKKLLDEIDKLPIFSDQTLEIIREYAMLNYNRDALKETIQGAYYLRQVDLTDFFKILDTAMDEMPSGALNGLTPNQAKEVRQEEAINRANKAKKYIKQENACLSKKDVKLFYKIYFALLEFTNNKYKINTNIKIYNREGINPSDIIDIVNKYWENKDQITLEFCMSNPFKFNSEELKLAGEFKKGIKNVFIICKYELEYTAFMGNDKVYMVKGLNVNIDEVIPYGALPAVVTTSIIPFKDNLVYDGILSEFPIKLGVGFEKMVERDYDSTIKYYHL